MWMSATGDFHDSFCSCWHPFAHILDLIFPEGHKDRNLTIEQIIQRDLQCHSGGDGEENSGGVGEGPTTAAEERPTEEKENQDTHTVEELIAAVEEAERR